MSHFVKNKAETEELLNENFNEPDEQPPQECIWCGRMFEAEDLVAWLCAECRESEGEEETVMHKIDFKKLEGLWNEEWVLELTRQLDERYVAKEELPPGTARRPFRPPSNVPHPPAPEEFVSRDDFDQHTAWQSQQRTAEWNRLMEHKHGKNGEVVFPADDLNRQPAPEEPELNEYAEEYEGSKVQPKPCEHPCHTVYQPDWKVCPIGCGLPLAKECGRRRTKLYDPLAGKE